MTRPTGIRWLAGGALAAAFAIAAGLWVLGCGAASPFATLAFTALFQPSPGPPAPPPTAGGGIAGGLCNLPTNQRGISIELRNASGAEVDFALVLVTTVGNRGFVCEEQRDTYISFGYEVERLDINLTKSFGCEFASLDGGEDILAARVDGTVQAKPEGEPFTLGPPPLDGATEIPLPSFIILGDDKRPSRFACDTIDFCNPSATRCAQGGFIYLGGSICRIPASRTQGTLCRQGVFASARWMLADPARLDRDARTFEYTKGSDIVITILDRRSSTDATVNQVVWRVTGLDGRIIHEEDD